MDVNGNTSALPRADAAAKFIALDSWRGLAACVVALVHLTAAGAFYQIPIIRHGAIAVPLFFVLSGFVITHAYGERLGDGPQARSFLIRRFGRLYPLHLFTLAALVMIEFAKLFLVSHGVRSGQAPFSGTNDLASLLANVFLLQAVIPFKSFTWNGPAWSISVEFYTYLAFTALMVMSKTRAKAAVRWAFLLTGVLLLTYELSGLNLEQTQGKGLLECLFGFLTGGVTYQVFTWTRARGLRLGGVAELAAAALALALFWFNPFESLGTMLGFAVVIAVFAHDGGWISRGLAAPLPRLLGRLSYSIYLVHFVLLTVINGVVRALSSTTGHALMSPGDVIDFGPPGAMDLLAVLYLLGVVGVAAVTYHLIEVPGRTFFNALSRGATIAVASRSAALEVFGRTRASGNVALSKSDA